MTPRWDIIGACGLISHVKVETSHRCCSLDPWRINVIIRFAVAATFMRAFWALISVVSIVDGSLIALVALPALWSGGHWIG